MRSIEMMDIRRMEYQAHALLAPIIDCLFGASHKAYTEAVGPKKKQYAKAG